MTSFTEDQRTIYWMKVFLKYQINSRKFNCFGFRLWWRAGIHICWHELGFRVEACDLHENMLKATWMKIQKLNSLKRNKVHIQKANMLKLPYETEV